MMHLDAEQVARHLHRELAPASAEKVRDHLAACPDCRARVEAAARDEAELHALLRLVDHPPPPVTAEAIASRARRPAPRRGAWAAGVLLTLTLGGVAYAQPDSRVRLWVQAGLAWFAGPEGSARVAAPPAPAQSEAGIAVPAGQAFSIQFTAARPLGRVRISLVDGTDVVVRAPGGAATFSSDVARLVIDPLGEAATFEIAIPRLAPRVEIRVAGGLVFRKAGPRITSAAPPDSAGTYLLPLIPSGP